VRRGAEKPAAETHCTHTDTDTDATFPYHTKDTTPDAPNVDPHDLGRLQDLAHRPHEGAVDAREGAAVEGIGLVEDDAHLWFVVSLDGEGGFDGVRGARWGLFSDACCRDEEGRDRQSRPPYL